MAVEEIPARRIFHCDMEGCTHRSDESPELFRGGHIHLTVDSKAGLRGDVRHADLCSPCMSALLKHLGGSPLQILAERQEV